MRDPGNEVEDGRFPSSETQGPLAGKCNIRDLKHHDGSHDDGIPEANFLFRSCAGTE